MSRELQTERYIQDFQDLKIFKSLKNIFLFSIIKDDCKKHIYDNLCKKLGGWGGES